MKGQSLVVQFLLFFVIGLGIFAAIGGVFRLQSDIVRGDIAEANRKLVGSYLSSIAVSMSSTCKECDFINQTLKLKNVTASYIVRFSLTKNGLDIFSEPGGGKNSVSFHNLGQAFDMNGNGASPFPIIFSSNNKLGKLQMVLKP